MLMTPLVSSPWVICKGVWPLVTMVEGFNLHLGLRVDLAVPEGQLKL